MQLRYYLAILWRFWLLILALPLAVGLLSLALELQQPQRYGASARVMVTHEPLVQRSGTENVPLLDFNMQHSWLTSEFILDDLPQVVTSRLFAEDVQLLLASQGITVAPETIQAGLRADNVHRTVIISSNAATPETAEALVGGAVTVLQDYGLKYWNRRPGNESGLRIAVLDPVGGAGPLSNRRQLLLNVGLRAGLALAAAVGLALLLHYFDDTLRERRQVEEGVGLPVIGTIPKE